MSSAGHPSRGPDRTEVVLGVVGGSGLYHLEALRNPESIRVDTPFGEPSAHYTIGSLDRPIGTPLRAVFLPRHGLGHRLLPSEINYRANIHGFKQLGVTHLLSVSAVGSLQEHIAPGHVVFVDQFIDRTQARASTFFGDGAVGHVQFGEPTDPRFRALGIAAARRAGAPVVHESGTCIVIEGPAFSTRAESELYRRWEASTIGMTALPEAKLAREAEMAYALMALATDYDCWHMGVAEVSVEAVVAVLRANVELAKRTIFELAQTLPVTSAELPFPRACEGAVMTAPDRIPASTRARLDLVIGHYLSTVSSKASQDS